MRLYGSGRCLDLAKARRHGAAHQTARPATYPRISAAAWCREGCREYDSEPVLGSPTAGCTQRVALLLSGTPRTFVRPHVHGSLRSNLVDALSERVSTFVVMSLLEPPPKGRRSTQAAPRAPSRRALLQSLTRALAALAPRAVVLEEGAPSAASAYGLALNRRCATRGFLSGADETSVREQHLLRTVAQPAAWALGLGLIEAAERSDGARFEWVVRARPDTWWFRPHPAACALQPATIYLHDWTDMAFVLPRAAAALVLRGMRDEYASCNGSFAHRGILDRDVDLATWRILPLALPQPGAEPNRLTTRTQAQSPQPERQASRRGSARRCGAACARPRSLAFGWARCATALARAQPGPPARPAPARTSSLPPAYLQALTPTQVTLKLHSSLSPQRRSRTHTPPLSVLPYPYPALCAPLCAPLCVPCGWPAHHSSCCPSCSCATIRSTTTRGGNARFTRPRTASPVAPRRARRKAQPPAPLCPLFTLRPLQARRVGIMATEPWTGPWTGPWAGLISTSSAESCAAAFTLSSSREWPMSGPAHALCPKVATAHSRAPLPMLVCAQVRPPRLPKRGSQATRHVPRRTAVEPLHPRRPGQAGSSARTQREVRLGRGLRGPRRAQGQSSTARPRCGAGNLKKAQ